MIKMIDFGEKLKYIEIENMIKRGIDSNDLWCAFSAVNPKFSYTRKARKNFLTLFIRRVIENMIPVSYFWC